MNLDKIQGLAPDQRKALEEHCLKVGEPLGKEEVKEEAKEKEVVEEKPKKRGRK